MDPLRTPLSTRGTRRPGRRTNVATWFLAATALVGLATLGGILAVGAPGHSGPTSFGSASAPVTHGDLYVGPGETYTISPASGSNVYFQGGNVTVAAGGTLIVENSTVSMVQFVADSGVPAQRLSHIYQFSDAGKVEFINSTLTTTTSILNAYVKLTVNVTGTLSLWQSAFEFPGWLDVYGSAASVLLNASTIGPNPLVPMMNADPALLADTSWAPTLSVSGGASFTMYASTYNGTYKDNTALNGYPGPLPLTNSTLLPISSAGGATDSAFATPTDSESLVQDWLYPTVTSGAVGIAYNASASERVTGSFTYLGTSYPLSFGLAKSANLEVTNASLPAAAVDAINAGGMLTYLNATGDFGTGPSAISVTFDSPTSQANITSVSVQLLPSLNYDLWASGNGTRVTTIDSTVDLSWGAVPSSATQQTAPYPWQSNKLYLSAGAQGYFANLSVYPTYQTYGQDSVVIPDATSTANFYRWLVVPVSGSGAMPVFGAHVAAFYSYTSNQTNNATANGLNDLAAADPALASYVNYKDDLMGLPSYGLTNGSGDGNLLVASSTVTSGDLPDGLFLGGYHVGVRVDSATVSKTLWFNASVTPYPYGLTYPASADLARNVSFPNFVPSSSVVVSYTPPGYALHAGQVYPTTGTVHFIGSGKAIIEVLAIASNGQRFVIGSTQATNGPFTVNISEASNMPSGSYSVNVSASYNGQSGFANYANAFSIPGSGSSATGLNEKILGLALWMWLAIAAGIVVAVVGSLVLLRATARGKLVECGECGELIPDDAVACPKCGAEFEHDLVRCSRCSSTIPADSKVCPECSAQLLGKPEEASADPERQGYAEFVERYRAEGKKELQENYSEGSFWDWWKRQPTYVPFSQWRLQQASGSRAGMTAPAVTRPALEEDEEEPVLRPAYTPRASAVSASPAPPAIPRPSPSPSSTGASRPASPVSVPAAAPPSSAPGLRACPSCAKEIPSEYLVCPFCGAVTQ